MSCGPNIYLAGPIEGAKNPNSWRRHWAHELITRGFRSVNPFSMSVHINEGGDYDFMCTPKSILDRDLHHVMNCDLVLANFTSEPKAQITSIGTIAEVAWAFLLHKPVVLLITKEQGEVLHPFIEGSASFIVHTEEDALFAIEHTLRDHK